MDHPFGKELARKTISWQDGPLLTSDTPVALGDKGIRANECHVITNVQVKNAEAGDAVNVIVFSYDEDADEYHPVHTLEYVEGAGAWGTCWIASGPGDQLYAALAPNYVAGTEVQLNVQGVYHRA